MLPWCVCADTWEAISDMVAAGPSGRSGVSSILLSAPGFDDNFNLWAGPLFAMLETCVGAIQAEEMIGVVCFHPQYVTPDGKSWPGFGHMHSVPRLKKWYGRHSTIEPAPEFSDDEIARLKKMLLEPAPELGDDDIARLKKLIEQHSYSSIKPALELSDGEIAAGGAWQRRTPHAVINVLRAEQLEAAEGRRSTGELYERNIRVLMGKVEGVGLEKLQEDLKREQNL